MLALHSAGRPQCGQRIVIAPRFIVFSHSSHLGFLNSVKAVGCVEQRSRDLPDESCLALGAKALATAKLFDFRAQAFCSGPTVYRVDLASVKYYGDP
ncbi:hypothetical protein WK34_21210 [Burkholderia vietnamiensis]|nr:hypothetical protein WK34_21210 [Burkholderia vietnamiensis]